MATGAPDRLERLFRAARLHPPAERSAFLEAACDDPALRAEVESLLAADAEADDGGFLDRPATGLLGDVAPAPPAPLVGQQVGPYRVLRPLGEGGMGAVYLAVRETPFLRHVALKVIRGGLGSPEAVHRFEQERQILAALEHPGIARLLDGGVTDDGLPFFALEYVEGRPITAYCDEHRLGVHARLDLFARVCDAVQYAHQNLVLHRDLKPSNVLVTASGGPGGGPQVKLLDFGIAKLLNPNLSAGAMPVTRTALRALTPEYASPEQVCGEPLSTASDVYSLGVVLYELLTGHRPYRLTRGSTDEIVRAVVETDPERPSTAAARDETIVHADGTTRTVTAAEVGAARDTSPEALRRALRGDLDTIVMMALRKEPARRYASAEALAQDLGRYRRGLPVHAHRDSRGYRLRKLLRRHPTEVALVAVVLASLLGVAVSSQWQAGRLAAERDRVQTEAAKAEEVSAFLVSLFEQVDPATSRGDTITGREMLEAGAARVETELAGQPEVQAAVLHVIARAYRGLGRDDRARPLLERAVALRRGALGADHPETLAALFDLGTLYAAAGEVDPAAAAFEAVLERRRARLGDTHPLLIQPLYHLGLTRHMEGRTEEALRLFDAWEALLDRLPEDDSPLLAEGLSDYADLLFTQRRYDEAEPYARRALAMRRRIHGDGSPEVGHALNRLADLLNATERPEAAAASAREALAIHRRLYPGGHRELGASLRALGEAARRRGRLGEAEPLFREDLALQRRLHGAAHFETAESYARLAGLAHDRGDLAEAERHYRAAIDIFTGQFGPTFLTTVQQRLDLAGVLVDAGRYAEAERMLLADYRTIEARGPEHRTVQEALRRLVRLYEAWGRPEAAAPYRRLVAASGEA